MIPLHITSAGFGKPTVILVHGFGAYGFFWRKWNSPLTDRHRVHTVDLMGFGRAPTPLSGDYSPAAQANRVAAFVRRVEGEGPAVLIGHSLGAGIVLLAALDLLRNGIPIAGLVLVSGAVYSQPFPTYLSLGRRRLLGETFLLCAPPFRVLKKGIQGIVGDPATVDAEQVEGYRTPLRNFRRRRAILRAVRQINMDEAFTPGTRLRELALPTLLIWGEEDRVVPLETGRQLLADLPRAHLITLPGVGHLPPEEAPQRSVAPVLDFLGSLCSSPEGRVPELA